MIEKIHLSGVATYAPATQSLLNLKEVNYFYGANGSGKTTISRVIGDPTHSDHGGCSLGWKGARPIDTLVYNRDFVEENFGGEDIKGVFTVGKRSVEALQEIARIKIDAAELDTKIANLRATLKGTDPEVESGKYGELAELSKKLQASVGNRRSNTKACWPARSRATATTSRSSSERFWIRDRRHQRMVSWRRPSKTCGSVRRPSMGLQKRRRP